MGGSGGGSGDRARELLRDQCMRLMYSSIKPLLGLEARAGSTVGLSLASAAAGASIPAASTAS